MMEQMEHQDWMEDFNFTGDKEMKKVLYLIVLMLIVMLFCGCASVPQTAGSPLGPEPLRLLRDTANEDYANFAAIISGITANSLGDYANMPTGVIVIPEGTKVVTLYVSGVPSNGDDDTLSIVPFGYSPGNGPMEVICDAAGILGTQDVVLYPDDGATATSAFWVDSWTITNDYWRTTVGVISNANGATGGNVINTISFDPLNLRYLGCYVHTAAGAADEAGSVTVFASFTREDT